MVEINFAWSERLLLPANEPVSKTEASSVVAVEDYTAQHSGDNSIEDKLANHDFVRSLAESQGTVLMNPKSVQDYASLLLRLYKKSLKEDNTHASPPQHGGAAPRMDSKASGSVRGSNSSLSDSRFDECDLDCNWSTVSSESTPYAHFTEPEFPRSPSQASEQTYAGESTRARQSMASTSQEDSSNSSWFGLGNSPRNSNIKNRGPITPSEEAFWEEEEGISPSQAEFEMHPGHKFWVWDVQRQRWRRRGRNGLEERDWFPESLA